MRLSHLAAALALAGASLLLAACGDTGVNDETAIREVNKKWLAAIMAKDASAIAQMHAEDGAMFPPNAPKAAGRDALEKGWAGLFKIPGVTLTFETERFVIAKSGDLAVDIGTYKFTSGEGASVVSDTGKSVVTWVKRDGKWYVLTDMFSSDAPPPPPPPAAPAETPAVEPSTTPAPATPPSP